jgi:SAM-dependent methyltransferase
MERAEWLEKMQKMTEALYDHISPEYWVNFGFYANETHLLFLQRLLDQIAPGSTLLSAACGAGRYDGMLLKAGQAVTGIDQSEGMLERARERFPQVKYLKMGLQDLNFSEVFDGAICMDVMENVCPEDWPGVMAGFHAALKPGGLLYFTVELHDSEELKASYERARAMGLPVVFGELGDEVELSFERVMSLTPPGIPGDLAGLAVYHYYPSMEQVRVWIDQAGFTLEEEGTGNDYAHFLVRKT